MTVRVLATALALNRCAFGEDGSPRPWFAAHALADAADLVATVAAGPTLPRRNLLFAGAMAGASTAVAIAGALAA